MELELWSGDWGLPSVDQTCLQILAFARFSGAPVKCKYSNNPWRSFTGTLPIFRHGPKVKLYSWNDVYSYLKNQNYNADFKLSKKDLSDVNAYSAMLSRKLGPALLHTFWIDHENYIKVTRPWYAKKIPFPGNYFIPGQLQRNAEHILAAQNEDLEIVDIESRVLSEARKCITLLSQKLDNSEFFFGKNPTSLDALVFSYLAPILKVPFPSFQQLKNHLQACENLVRFVERILQKYFPLCREKDKETGDNGEIDPEFPHKWRDIAFSVMFASAAMLTYAVGMGILRIELNRSGLGDEGDEEEEEDEEAEDADTSEE